MTRKQLLMIHRVLAVSFFFVFMLVFTMPAIALDGNAILGQWPELDGFYLANGFSGHGLQQAPAVGRYLSELILNKPLSLDLSIFSPQRILENRALSENGLV